MSHRNRKREINAIANPAPGMKGYDEYMEALNEYIKKHPENDKIIFENFKKARNILLAQIDNGANLPLDRELRYFLKEYNYRIFNYGLRTMPSSFNVLEAFFNYQPILNIFELINEENYLFSMFDFVDFVTSSEFKESQELITENIAENLIYHFDIINDLDLITFTTEDGNDYVIGGVSLVRRGMEVVVFLLTGLVADTAEETKKLLASDDGFTPTPGKEGMKVAEDRKLEAVKLFCQPNYWKTLAYCRIDITKNTIDARYIQKDIGTMYQTITDDISGLADSTGELEEELYENQTKAIKAYSPIFELATKCLYLPHYFNQFESLITEEEHQTELSSKKQENLIFDRKNKPPVGYNIKERTVFCLDINAQKKSDLAFLGENDFKIERSGYWKQIQPGSKGKDKNGSPIHSKTWVEKIISWHESDKQTLIAQFKKQVVLKPGSRQGYIYLLRNASHEIDIFKIGFTTLSPKERAKQLSSTTGSPDKFLVADQWFSFDCTLAEKTIHERLNKYRLNEKREFFKVAFDIAIKTINEIVKMVNAASELK